MPQATEPRDSETAAIEAQGLSRAYASRMVVDGVSFRLDAGDCLALFGPNGAGKTTLLRLVAGLLAPSAGRCLIGGVAIRSGAHARAQVGIVSHASMLYAALTVRENVEFAARLYGVADPRAAALSALRAMRVHDRVETPVRSLSRGLQQRVSIARAIVHEPRVLLCDEPYTGLDEVGSAALTEALAERRAQGATLVLVTHNLGEGLALATHAAIMRRGKVVRYETRTGVNAESYASEYRDLVAADA